MLRNELTPHLYNIHHTFLFKLIYLDNIIDVAQFGNDKKILFKCLSLSFSEKFELPQVISLTLIQKPPESIISYWYNIRSDLFKCKYMTY